MKNKIESYEKIRHQLIDASAGRYPQQNQQEGKNMLLKMLSWLRELKTFDPVELNNGVSYWPYMDYLDDLQYIYFYLMCGEYKYACGKVEQYLARHSIKQRRVYDALVILLEKVEKGEL